MLLEGMYLPLTTPFYPDGRLNLRKLEQNIARYSKTPAAGLVVLGAQGEASLLSDEETRAALLAAADAADATKVLVAGVARDSVAATLELIDSAAVAGYDVALVSVPRMLNASQQRQALLYFEAVADRAALPIISENKGDARLSDEEVAVLAGHARILGMVGEGSEIAKIVARTAAVKREVTVTTVFAAVTGRMAKAAGQSALISAGDLTGSGGGTAVAAPAGKLLKTRTRVVGFQVLAGSTTGMLAGLRAGSTGVVPGFGGCAPQACYEVYAAWKDGDQGLADEKQDRLMAPARLAEDVLGVGGIKFGCDLNGYFGGRPRLPLLPPNGLQRNELEGLMKGLRS
jgi:dihydrodipicolinate synthase/N-acetylneuraminate lyase